MDEFGVYVFASTTYADLFVCLSVTPHTQCRLKLLKQERIKDYLLMEEEFIRNQEQMKPLEEKQEVSYCSTYLYCFCAMIFRRNIGTLPYLTFYTDLSVVKSLRRTDLHFSYHLTFDNPGRIYSIGGEVKGGRPARNPYVRGHSGGNHR